MGRLLVPFAYTGLSLYATTKFKRESVCVCRAPFGYVVTSAKRPQTPQQLISDTETAMDRFRG
jgi:hypothetical protein